MIAVKSNYPAEDIEIEIDCEVVWISVLMRNNRKVYLGSFYRPPDKGQEPFDELEKSLSHIDLTTRNNPNSVIILGGDFNVPQIDWSTGEVLPGCTKKQPHEQILEVLADHHLTQIQHGATRHKNILDLYCTNKPSLVKHNTVIPGISDHEIVVIDAALRPQFNKKVPRKVYVYAKAKWDSIKQDMRNFTEQLSTNLTNNDVNTNWSLLKQHLRSSMDRHIPSKTTSHKQHLPWITPAIRKMCRKKQRSYNLAKHTHKAKHWERFSALKRDTRNALHSAHWYYMNSIFEESLERKDSSIFWRYVKSQRQDSIGVPPLKRNGQLYSGSAKKASILSDQFQSAFTPDSGNTAPELEGNHYPSISALHVSTSEIAKLLVNLKVRKASGPDDIPARALRELAQELAPPLSFVFNQSLTSGVIPDDWKNTHVSPIHKKGSKHQAENYRPISLTCICSKLLEHVVCRHIMSHLEEHNILTHLHHGFRSGVSTVTQLLVTTQDIFCQWDNKTQVDIAVLDFAKAFDKVPHRSLLNKLHHYGIDNNIHTWITSFLTNRIQSVVVDGATSPPTKVISGVPQGTVLGPLLFLLYINDLPSIVSSQVRLFADDCIVYRAIQTVQDQLQLQKDLNNLEQWAKKWGMELPRSVRSCASAGHRSHSSTYTPLAAKSCQKSTRPNTWELHCQTPCPGPLMLARLSTRLAAR